MIDQKIGLECTGCTACKNICPKKAVQMQQDMEGFIYPKIDSELCINCNLCETVCPVLNRSVKAGYGQPLVYAGWNRDIVIRINSTSGGVFSAIGRYVIMNGGYVVGAVYDTDFSIHHIISNQLKDLERLRQSKYAQSNLNTIFIEVKMLLQKEKFVLFCGTPCQCAGLQNFLGKEYSSLYCCDFICRGVISQKVYHKFLNDMEEKYDSNLIRVHFKNKDYGWNRFSTKLSFDNNLFYQRDRDKDYYMRGYLKHNLYLRPCCYECQFKTIPRRADISLGDFWGIGNYNAALDDNQGTSVILINSEKGKRMLEWMKDDLYLEQRKLEEVLKGNDCLLNSAKSGEFREYFFKNIEKYRFDKLIEIIDEKALHLSLKDRIFRFFHDSKLKLIGKKNE